MTATTTERVGRYQLLEPIGFGPTGTVSRAKVFGVAGFERQFAIKRFHADLTSTAAMAQALSAAARAYGGLEHPRIARMSEFGIAQGTTFTAVELVTGLDAFRLIAEARLASTALAAGGALALVSQAARAVGYAHGRGLTHLGLSPTNVIVTAEGDIKITDFGILAATLPQRPIDVARLAQRIQYLAPEQLANEATSAATDVFALGVLAYELVTGQRTFRGETPQQVAQSVMTGPPAEPPLPRPIVRVLQRCLARSPFERFPDARALADALDAALRVAPVPGTRKDIGALVKQTLERLAELHSGELSGMVAFNLNQGTLGTPPAVARDAGEGEFATTEFVRPDTPVAGPAALVGPAREPAAPDREPIADATIPDLMKQPFMTVPGLAPPPIPVPPGVAPPIPPPPAAQANGPNTLLGIATATRPEPRGPRGMAPPIPTIKPPPTPPLRNTPPPGAMKTVAGAMPPSRPSPLPAPSPQPAPDGPPDRPSETAVSPLRFSTAQPEVASVPSLGRMAPAARRRTPGGGSPVMAPTPPAGMPVVRAETAEPAPLGPAPAHPPLGGLLPSTDALGDDADLTIATDPGDETVARAIDIPAQAVREPEPPPEPDPDDEPRPEDQPELDISVAMPHNQTIMGLGTPMPRARSRNFETEEMSPRLIEKLSVAASKQTSEMTPLIEEALLEETFLGETAVVPSASAAASPAVPAAMPTPAIAPAMAPLMMTPSLSEPLRPQPPAASPMHGQRNVSTAGVRVPQQSRRTGWIIGGVLGAVVLAAGGFIAKEVLFTDDATKPATKPVVAAASDAGATSPGDAPVAVATAIDATTHAPTDAAIAHAVVDAGGAPRDAAVAIAASDAGKPAAPSGDSLAITSSPSGARVFLDGADAGATPLKLPGTTDRHTVALVLPGHELYVAQVDGHGAFSIPMKPVTPTNGPAGIKVLKCVKDRYYVFVDGKPTGQNCPTERIGVEVGPHVVEVYDVVSESRRKWEIEVKDTRLSYRVKVE